jgi:large subunit ribosomal protein L9
MKVLLRQNVTKLGQIGDVVEVLPGYARNYLIPQGLASVPTQGNIKALEAEKQAYLQQLAQQRAALQARADAIKGKEVTIFARANEEGHLYGSVGPAQIAAAVSKEGVFLEPENIVLDEPIRRLDKYEVSVRFAEDVQTTLAVWVVPPRETGEAQEQPADEADSPAGEAVPDETGEAGSADEEVQQE